MPDLARPPAPGPASPPASVPAPAPTSTPPSPSPSVPLLAPGAAARPPGGRPASTGHPGVDAVLARLEALDGVPTEAHVPVYEDVHQRLGDILAALDRP